MSKTRYIILFLIAAILVAGGLFWWNNIGRRTAPPPATGNDIPVASSIAENLEIPRDMVFLPDNSIIVAERPGTVRLIDPAGTLQIQPVLTFTDIAAVGEGGLLGVALHPQFATNHWVYFYYTYHSGTGLANRVVRFTLQGATFGDRTLIFEGIPGGNIRDGGRIAFGPDGFLYICAGDAGTDYLAQDLNSLAGKILRIQDDGAIPVSNPFPDSSIYSYGHRDPQGLVWDEFGRLWEIEQGPSSQDEINQIQPAQNYGWPEIHGDETSPGMINPVFQSEGENLAPSGLAYLNGILFFAGLNSQSLYSFDIKTNALNRNLNGKFGRLGNVIKGPDGLLYVLTSNRDGRGIPLTGDDRLIRINPEKLSEAT